MHTPFRHDSFQSRSTTHWSVRSSCGQLLEKLARATDSARRIVASRWLTHDGPWAAPHFYAEIRASGFASLITEATLEEISRMIRCLPFHWLRIVPSWPSQLN